MRIDRIDHLVLTVADLDRTVAFYRDVLGMEAVVFDDDHHALQFGGSKINLHQAGHELEPKAEHPGVGTADLCFTTLDPLDQVQAELETHGVVIIEGPGPQTGARSQLQSVYLRDPDGNLIEISNEVSRSAPIRHTVAFTLRHPAGSPEEADFLRTALRLAEIPGVEDFVQLRQVSPKSSHAFSFAMTFADDAAYQAYNAHPVHTAFVDGRWALEVTDFQELDFVTLAAAASSPDEI